MTLKDTISPLARGGLPKLTLSHSHHRGEEAPPSVERFAIFKRYLKINKKKELLFRRVKLFLLLSLERNFSHRQHKYQFLSLLPLLPGIPILPPFSSWELVSPASTRQVQKDGVLFFFLKNFLSKSSVHTLKCTQVYCSVHFQKHNTPVYPALRPGNSTANTPEAPSQKTPHQEQTLHGL